MARPSCTNLSRGDSEIRPRKELVRPDLSPQTGHPQNGLGLIWLGSLHTLHCLILAPINGLELSLFWSGTGFSNDSLLAVLLGYSLFGFPLILLGLCLHQLEQQHSNAQQTLQLPLALGLALLCGLAVLVQPYSVFWLGLFLAGRIGLSLGSKANL